MPRRAHPRERRPCQENWRLPRSSHLAAAHFAGMAPLHAWLVELRS
jgi:hypothetical protein